MTHGPAAELTGPEFANVLTDQSFYPVLYNDVTELYGKTGPRAVSSGRLPYARPDGSEVHALIWSDRLMLLSPAIFRALGGTI